MAENKSSLQNILQAVLSVANTEQNFFYPPSVYQNNYNAVTSFLLDALSKVYPEKVDILLPFIKSKKIPVENGVVPLPEDYRNLLGAPSISFKPDGSDCDGTNPVIIDTESEFKQANRRSGCKTVPIEILDKAEWDYRTTSTYAFPTLQNPIGLFVGRQLKVCPYDLMRVEVTYVKVEKIYTFNYITQPDDTWIFGSFDKSITPIETEWTDSAFQYLFRGVLSLYSAYCRDNTLSDYSRVLNEASLI